MRESAVRNSRGQFIKGRSGSSSTQFKPGQHWRPWRLYWHRGWLFREYTVNKRSAADISAQFGVTENAMLFWLAKHHIKARSMSEVRKIKKWGVEGPANPMFGKTGVLSPNWKGGLTPLRQKIYSTRHWLRARKTVRCRDRICRLCASNKRLEIHHIIPFSEAPLLIFETGNMILLCYECHKQTRGKEGRWKKRLFALIDEGNKLSDSHKKEGGDIHAGF